MNYRDYFGMEVIDMGLNTDPASPRAPELKKQIVETVEREGQARLSWSCTGRTRHEMHAYQWSQELPQYEFEIRYEDYLCIARKR